MTQWRTLPTRQPGEAISAIEYRVEHSQGCGRSHITLFRHRDNRIWQARLYESDVTAGDDAYSHVAELSCTGCRSWMFLSSSVDQGKRTISRFVNLALDLYQRLVADAAGTTDFPVSGVEGVFRLRTIQRTPGGLVPEEITGIARCNGAQIIVFPTSTELSEILTRVCASGTVALVPQGINEIPDTDEPAGFLVTPGGRTNRLAAPVVTDVDFNTALDRLRNDTLERAFSGLASGEYRTTRQREERVLDLFD